MHGTVHWSARWRPRANSSDSSSGIRGDICRFRHTRSIAEIRGITDTRLFTITLPSLSPKHHLQYVELGSHEAIVGVRDLSSGEDLAQLAV